MPFFGRLRKTNKPKTVPKCQDGCCYTNAGYAAPSVTESAVSQKRPTISGGASTQSSEMGIKARPIFRRGETFTMKDGPPDDDLPEHLKCRTFTKKKEPSIKTDVFEAMYTKRPNKPAPVNTQRSIPIAYTSNLKASPRQIGIKSTKTRPHSINIPTTSSRTTTIKIPALTQPKPTTARSPAHQSPSPATRKPVSTKPREYLFGSTDRPTKENVQNKENEDRFKTITLKDVRRSFREKYLTNDKAEERKHQPIWFVDVKGNGDVMRPELNIANRRSQTRSIHGADDRTSLDRETYIGDGRSRSNSYRSNDSVQLRRSPSAVVQPDRTFGDRDSLHRSSSISNTSNMYATYKKDDSQFAGIDYSFDFLNEKQYESRSPNDSITTIRYERERSPSPVRDISNRSSVDRDFDHKSESVDYNDPLWKPRVTVNRKNTFKVVRDIDDRPAPGSSSLKRRDTFVVEDPQPVKPIADPQRGYYLNRYRRLIDPDLTTDPIPTIPERPSKVVPIGIATPYNFRNDSEDHSRASENRSRFAASRHSTRDVRDESPPLYESTTFMRRKSPEIGRHSPVRRSSPERRRPVSPAPRKSPEPRPTSPTKKTFLSRSSFNNLSDTLKKPIESVKISFESLRKPVSPPRDPNQTNLGFDRFYDPNYYVPKNQNVFGPLATANLRQVNLSVQPKKVHDPSSRSTWLYNK